MKKVIYFLIVLLLCAAFAGTVSAWNSNSAANINPSGSLMPGDTVHGTIDIKILKDTSVYRINLYSDLTSPVWTGTLTGTDGTPITEFPAGRRYIDGYPLSGLPYDTVLTIYLDGRVPDNKAGAEITVMTVEQVTDSASVVSTYSSQKQAVYNPADIPKQITDITEGIKTLDADITEVSKLDANPSSALEKLGTARSHAEAADRSRNDPPAATQELTAASADLAEAKKLMVNAALTKAKNNLDLIGQNIANLQAKGWNDNRVVLLSTSKQNAEIQYNAAKNAFDTSTSSVSDLTKTQSLDALRNSAGTLNESNILWEEAQKGIFENIGPYLIYIVIGVVAVIVVIGAIFVIRNRNDDWDELG